MPQAGRRLLLVTHTFPPEVAMGSRRPWGLYRNLHHHGWETVVLTASPGGSFENVVRVPHQRAASRFRILAGASPNGTGPLARAIRFGLDRISEVCLYPDVESGWRKPAVDSGLAMISGRRFDAILSTSMPATTHVVARDLKSHTGLPWVADLRDLWSENYDYRWGRLRKAVDRQIERSVLARSNALVTVSEPLASALRRLHTRPVIVIPNGYAPEELATDDHPLTQKFTLTYTGTLYPAKQDPLPLFRVLATLISSGEIDPETLEVRFIGRNVDQPWLRSRIIACGLERNVILSNLVPRDQALERQRESQILLALDWMDERQPGVYSGKIFEYLAARRPVLCVGRPGTVADALLRETGAGGCLHEAAAMRAFLTDSYREYADSGRVRYSGRSEVLGRFDHNSMARQFAAVLGHNVRS